MLKKKERNQNGVPFQVEALLPFHKEHEQLHIPAGLDLNPIIIFF